MKRQLVIQVFCLLAITASIHAQSTKASVVGQWEGESICTVKNSPCHDEHVIYRITENAKSPGRFTVAAYKVVNGEELNMGDLDCGYIVEKSELQCHFKPTDSWIYKLSSDTMQGTLTINGNTLYRKVNVKRVPVTPVH